MMASLQHGKLTKKTFHFDTLNNKNPTKQAYQNCILPIVTPLKHVKSISLKSVELPFVLNSIGVTDTKQTIELTMSYPNNTNGYAVVDANLNFQVQFPKGNVSYSIPLIKNISFGNNLLDFVSYLNRSIQSYMIANPSINKTIGNLIFVVRNTDHGKVSLMMKHDSSLGPLTFIFLLNNTLAQLGFTGDESGSNNVVSEYGQNIIFQNLPSPSTPIPIVFSYSIPISGILEADGDMNQIIDAINTNIESFLTSLRNNGQYATLSPSSRLSYTYYTLGNFKVTFSNDSTTNKLVALLSVWDHNYENPISSRNSFTSVQPFQLSFVNNPLLTLLGAGTASTLTSTTYNTLGEQTIFFPNIYQLQVTSYVNMYLSNLPIQTTSASGLNTTFKVPLNFQNNLLHVSNVIGNEKVLMFFYNENLQFSQKIELNDDNFILKEIKVSLLDRAGNSLSATVVPLDFSFSLEVEYLAK